MWIRQYKLATTSPRPEEMKMEIVDLANKFTLRMIFH